MWRIPTARLPTAPLIKKMRLDVFLAENGYALSRTEAKGFITSGAVTVDGKRVEKPAYEITEGQTVEVNREVKRYVSRGGLKLEGALLAFEVNASGRDCIDVGASSGGFTDCLLKHGAKRVVAVDSGTDQLVQSLRLDERVISIENYNARYMKREDIPFAPTLAVMDVSFISATYVIKPLSEILPDGADFICLIKPQFEVGRAAIGKGGIVKSEKERERAVEKVTLFASSCGFALKGLIKSPIEGGDGNIEYLAHFKKEGGSLEQGNNHSQSHEG